MPNADMKCRKVSREQPAEKDARRRQDDSTPAEHDAKEVERARIIAERHEEKAAAAFAVAQEAAAALGREREQKRLHDLELQHEKDATEKRYEHERELLQQELKRREEQNSQLSHLTTQLEEQLQGKQDFMKNLQQTTSKTDQTIEVLASTQCVLITHFVANSLRLSC